MTLIILKELEEYTVNTTLPLNKHDFIRKLNLDPTIKKDTRIYNSVLNELEKTSFFKHTTQATRLEDIDTEYDEDNDEDSYTKNKETFHFTFTGILIVKGLSIVVYPKHVAHIEEDKELKKFKQIIHVIKKYQKRTQTISLFEDEEVNTTNKLSLAIQILDYYNEYGLYTVENSIVEENGEGDILWEKTINEMPIVFSGKSPVYLNTYTDSSQFDDQNLVRLIQMAVMNDIKHTFADVLNIMDYNNYHENDVSLDSLGDDTHLIYNLDKEARTQFISHNIELINLLSLYIKDASRDSESSSINVFGVNHFYHVWEDVCKVVYKNDLDKTIAELGLKYDWEKSERIKRWVDKENIKMPLEKLKLKDIVEKPKWSKTEDKETYYSKSSLKLDVLHIDKANKEFRIYDAKYYLTKFKNGKVINPPGIGDITKQYLYQLAYREFAKEQSQNKEKEYTFSNQFIIPKDNYQDKDKGKHTKPVATISLDMFKEYSLSNIDVIPRDCETMFKEYLAHY